MHMSDDFNALSEVAIGVTSFRNPGGSIELAQSQTQRRVAGTLLAPEGFTSVIVDGKGPLAAQGSITVASEAETIAAVHKIKDAGMTGVKFYTSMTPAWIAPAAAEAHRLGLHVHGHIPAGMRTLDAINAGYDEITHIYFATMQAMPAEVVAKSNGLMRLLGPGKYFKDVDFNAEPTRTVIATMAKRHIVLDPTLVVVEGVLMAQAGNLGEAYRPFAGTLPPATERGFKTGPLPLPAGTTRADVAAELPPHGRLRERAAQSRRADRCRDRWNGPRAGARARALRPKRDDASRGVGDRNHCPRAQRPRRKPHRIDRGRQGSRSAASGRRPVEAHRRPPPCRQGDDRRRVARW